jgi:hypothetical protein
VIRRPTSFQILVATGLNLGTKIILSSFYTLLLKYQNITSDQLSTNGKDGFEPSSKETEELSNIDCDKNAVEL